MAFNMMITFGLAIAFAGMCLCQQQQSAVSQASFQTGSAAVQPQTKLEDIERDSLSSALALQKTAAQQSGSKSSAAAIPPQQQQQAYLTAAAPQQQYYVQQQPSYQTANQFYVQPYQTAQQPQYLAQPFQMAFDYAGVQYMIINPNGYNPAVNQVYQPYYVPAVPQPSAVPQYVTKTAAPSSASASANSNTATTAAPAAAAQQTEYKLQQQQFAAPAAGAQAQQEYKYVLPAAAPAYQYAAQQQSAATPAGSGAVDFSYLTRHPAAPSAQFKAPAASAQPHYLQYTVPQQQQQQQYQQLPQQFYYSSSPFVGQVQQSAEQQPRGQQLSAKSQFSSGVKSTTPSPYKETFAYKFESTPSQQQQQQQPQQQQQQQQPGATYSTLRFSA